MAGIMATDNWMHNFHTQVCWLLSYPLV